MASGPTPATDVIAAWARIGGWLREHTPRSAAMLAGPASPEQITAVSLGFDLPPDLVASLRCHDGLTDWANILPEAAPLSVAGIAEQVEIRMDVAEDVDGFAVHPPNDEPWWSELWVPFADAEGDLQVIDLRPGPGHGRLGMAPHDNPADFTGAWPSLGAYLTAVADALHTGGPVGEWHPYLTEDDELWWSLADQTDLNGRPLRPVRPRAGS
ncbi:SMI1/KNR4 family protein [Actinoplanes missouriensis]|uniref:SMI1/KNR4 family protein n=1 Tax=Actinoplanes missouriensis TaxID=1866 RepID=UPI0033E61C9A